MSTKTAARSKQQQITFRVSLDVLYKLNIIAARDRRSRTQTILYALDQLVREIELPAEFEAGENVSFVDEDGDCIECGAGEHEHCLHSRNDTNGRSITCKCFIRKHKV